MLNVNRTGSALPCSGVPICTSPASTGSMALHGTQKTAPGDRQTGQQVPDQRQQQINPASKQRDDPTEVANPLQKQPAQDPRDPQNETDDAE